MHPEIKINHITDKSKKRDIRQFALQNSEGWVHRMPISLAIMSRLIVTKQKQLPTIVII